MKAIRKIGVDISLALFGIMVFWAIWVFNCNTANAMEARDPVRDVVESYEEEEQEFQEEEQEFQEEEQIPRQQIPRQQVVEQQVVEQQIPKQQVIKEEGHIAVIQGLEERMVILKRNYMKKRNELQKILTNANAEGQQSRNRIISRTNEKLRVLEHGLRARKNEISNLRNKKNELTEHYNQLRNEFKKIQQSETEKIASFKSEMQEVMNHIQDLSNSIEELRRQQENDRIEADDVCANRDSDVSATYERVRDIEKEIDIEEKHFTDAYQRIEDQRSIVMLEAQSTRSDFKKTAETYELYVGFTEFRTTKAEHDRKKMKTVHKELGIGTHGKKKIDGINMKDSGYHGKRDVDSFKDYGSGSSSELSFHKPSVRHVTDFPDVNKQQTKKAFDKKSISESSVRAISPISKNNKDIVKKNNVREVTEESSVVSIKIQRSELLENDDEINHDRKSHNDAPEESASLQNSQNSKFSHSAQHRSQQQMQFETKKEVKKVSTHTHKNELPVKNKLPVKNELPVERQSEKSTVHVNKNFHDRNDSKARTGNRFGTMHEKSSGKKAEVMKSKEKTQTGEKPGDDDKKFLTREKTRTFEKEKFKFKQSPVPVKGTVNENAYPFANADKSSSSSFLSTTKPQKPKSPQKSKNDNPKNVSSKKNEVAETETDPNKTDPNEVVRGQLLNTLRKRIAKEPNASSSGSDTPIDEITKSPENSSGSDTTNKK
ncbi:MAG: hypothetical protein LBI63_03650 [Candidatus Ancillula sp.]|jgi:hypothetical protein|nr:hypothetical protein [Candidatus Ancillula sp.]